MRSLARFVFTGYVRSIADTVFLLAIPAQILVLTSIAVAFEGELQLRVALWAGVVLAVTVSVAIAAAVISMLSRMQDRYAEEVDHQRSLRSTARHSHAVA